MREGAFAGGTTGFLRGILTGNSIIASITASTGAISGFFSGLFGNFKEADDLEEEYLQSHEKRQEYIDSLGTAGLMTIRTVAQNEIAALATYDEDTQNILKDAFVSMSADLLDENGLNAEKFNKIFTSDVKANLESAIKTDNIQSYYDFLENSNKEVRDSILKTSSVFAGIYELGKENVRLVSKMGLSMDKVNTVWATSEKLALAQGQTTTSVFKDMILNAEEYSKKGMSSSQAMYAAIAQQEEESREHAKAVLEGKIQDQQYANDQLRLNNAKEAELTAKKAYDTAASASDFDEDSEKAKKLKKAYEDATVETADAQKAVDRWTETAKGANSVLEEAQDLFLIDDPITNYTDNLAKLGSTLERISKINDITNLSIADQMNLLADYPELLGAMEKGTLNAATALEILQTQFDKEQEKLKTNIADVGIKYGVGNNNKIVNQAFGANIFNNQDKLRELYDLGEEGFAKKYGDALGDNLISV